MPPTFTVHYRIGAQIHTCVPMPLDSARRTLEQLVRLGHHGWIEPSKPKPTPCLVVHA